MINLRLAEILAHEIHGTGWEAACLGKGLNPSIATADDVLGPMRGDMWDAGGKRVLGYDDDIFRDLLDELEAEPVLLAQDPKAFVNEVAEITGLTKTEKRVVYAIVDGSPIPDGKDYTGPLAKRLSMNGTLLRKHWSNAKKKIRDNWAAQ